MGIASTKGKILSRPKQNTNLSERFYSSSSGSISSDDSDDVKPVTQPICPIAKDRGPPPPPPPSFWTNTKAEEEPPVTKLPRHPLPGRIEEVDAFPKVLLPDEVHIPI